jgi:organic hydroperoxide reductase OsmC/OhrA
MKAIDKTCASASVNSEHLFALGYAACFDNVCPYSDAARSNLDVRLHVTVG